MLYPATLQLSVLSLRRLPPQHGQVFSFTYCINLFKEASLSSDASRLISIRSI